MENFDNWKKLLNESKQFINDGDGNDERIAIPEFVNFVRTELESKTGKKSNTK